MNEETRDRLASVLIGSLCYLQSQTFYSKSNWLGLGLSLAMGVSLIGLYSRWGP